MKTDEQINLKADEDLWWEEELRKEAAAKKLKEKQLGSARSKKWNKQKLTPEEKKVLKEHESFMASGVVEEPDFDHEDILELLAPIIGLGKWSGKKIAKRITK